MVQRVDYFALLSRAVEALERDAYAARGAIYDREHKAMLKRLISSSAPCTDADIAREEQAFRDAVRRIEFPDEAVSPPRVPLRQPAEAPWPASGRERARALRRETSPLANQPAPEANRAAEGRWDWTRDGEREPARQRTAPPPASPQDNDGPGWTGEVRRTRSFLRLALAYLLVTTIVLGAGGLGYAYMIGAIDLPGFSLWPGQAPLQSERALLFEGGPNGRTGQPIEGKAIWRTRTEPGSAGGKPDTVVTLEVQIPDPKIDLSATISRVVDAGSSMSHLLELQFGRPQDAPFGGVSRISNIGLKDTQTNAAESLIGTSINIAPGQFMFGLLGVEDVVKQNVERLRTQSWIDFTLIFGSGAAYTLSVEKGVSGTRAMDEALAKWGQ
jgi:hypothetical protein